MEAYRAATPLLLPGQRLGTKPHQTEICQAPPRHLTRIVGMLSTPTGGTASLRFYGGGSDGAPLIKPMILLQIARGAPTISLENERGMVGSRHGHDRPLAPRRSRLSGPAERCLVQRRAAWQRPDRRPQLGQHLPFRRRPYPAQACRGNRSRPPSRSTDRSDAEDSLERRAGITARE